MQQHLVALNHIQNQINELEGRIQQRVEITPNIQILKTLPGVANILSITIEREVGNVNRFPSSAQFASYAGTVPTVKSSGGKTLIRISVLDVEKTRTLQRSSQKSGHPRQGSARS